MRRTILAIILMVSVPTLAFAAPDHAPDHVLVKLRGPVDLPAFGEVRAKTGLESVDGLLQALGALSVERLLPPAPVEGQALAASLGLDRWCVVRFAEGIDVVSARDALAATAGVEVAELDQWGEGAAITPNDPSFGTQWHHKNNVKPGADNHATDGWTRTTGSSAVTVAILDSGGDWDHPDLAARIWSNPGEVPFNSVDDDGNGYVDDVRGWDFVNNDNNPMDDHNHGTNVSGIVGATTNNGVGVAGTDWNCRIMLAKNLDASNSGFYSWWISSIYYAANKGAKVLNMSEGGSSFSAAMQDAVNYAHGLGALVVVAMMNNNNSTPYYPAAYTNTIAVGATNDQDRRAVPFCWGGGSSYGAHIDMCAPGDWIYSTLIDSYGYFCGTSQATPQVSAAAALVWALRPSLTNAEVRSLLLANSDDQVGLPAEDTAGWDQYHGYGRLNLYRLLTAAVVGVGHNPLATSLEIRVAPNPARDLATLRYRLPSAGHVEAEVFDLAGRRVAGIARNGAPAGDGALELDTSGLASGVYLLRTTFRAGGETVRSSGRIAVVR
ncbi:MAG TPA: S8 family serine peptidase [Candidatus Eisenbacteria bacterium]|nr:S8 family serine peptidase [Candidatus Eisenbacteria bacterium]